MKSLVKVDSIKGAIEEYGEDCELYMVIKLIDMGSFTSKSYKLYRAQVKNVDNEDINLIWISYDRENKIANECGYTYRWDMYDDLQIEYGNVIGLYVLVDEG